jgi:hypothetical protein
MTEPRVATCIFCDDIRNETGNKISLMGIYAGNMIFSTPPPVVIPKFGIVLLVISDIGDEPDRMTITVSVPPEQTELLKWEVQKPSQIEHTEGATKLQIRALLTLGPLQITEQGSIEVIVDTGRETIRAGRLPINFTSPGTGDLASPSGVGA